MTGTTTAAREAWAARRLGATPEHALALVDRLVAEDRLGDGAGLVVVLHAARRGLEPADAAAELAAGERALPVAPSPYERRTAADEMADAWRHDDADEAPDDRGDVPVPVTDDHLGWPASGTRGG